MSGGDWQIYLILLLGGVLLAGAEIYLPGGVLGVIGGLSLLGALVFGFVKFPPAQATLNAALILGLAAVGLLYWLVVFPRSRAGRRLTLEKDGHAFKSAGHELENLAGATGTAQTALRPGGLAWLNGRKVDVVTEGQFVEAGEPIRVLSVQGRRVIVTRAASSATGPA